MNIKKFQWTVIPTFSSITFHSGIATVVLKPQKVKSGDSLSKVLENNTSVENIVHLAQSDNEDLIYAGQIIGW